MNSWHSYPSIYALGHRAVKDLFSVPINVEEKVDGSQFSFGKFLDDQNLPYLRFRSKSVQINGECPPKMFARAVQSVKDRMDLLPVGWTFRGEVLDKPKHNVLAYERVPFGHIIIFDVNIGEEDYLSYEDKALWAEKLGLEVVPLIATFESGADYDKLRSIIDHTQSILGGQKIEGVVCKPRDRNLFSFDKKLLLGKFVGEEFKEVAAQVWGPGGENAKPQRKDIISHIGMRYGTQARWLKAVQHLRDAGKIDDSPKDIGLLMKEIPEDVFKEELEDIKEMLFNFFAKDIRRVITTGVPEWYKDQLLQRQFTQAE